MAKAKDEKSTKSGRGALQVVRDILVIITCLLIIFFLVFTLVVGVTLVNKIPLDRISSIINTLGSDKLGQLLNAAEAVG